MNAMAQNMQTMQQRLNTMARNLSQNANMMQQQNIGATMVSTVSPTSSLHMTQNQLTVRVTHGILYVNDEVITTVEASGVVKIQSEVIFLDNEQIYPIQ